MNNCGVLISDKNFKSITKRCPVTTNEIKGENKVLVVRLDIKSYLVIG
jgi:hypothetical protein